MCRCPGDMPGRCPGEANCPMAAERPTCSVCDLAVSTSQAQQRADDSWLCASCAAEEAAEGAPA